MSITLKKSKHTIWKFGFLILLQLIVNSCTKVIDIDLSSSDPQIVIEGNVSNNGLPSTVRITESIDFDESSYFPGIEGATIIINDNLGNSDILLEISPGNYSSSIVIGEIGNTYFLTVEVDGRNLASSSTIPNQVEFDSLNVDENISSGGGFGGGVQSASHDITVHYQDPEEEDNYYRFMEYINGEFKQSYIFDDRLSNGLTMTQNLSRNDRDLNIGDTIRIEMQCVDSSVYDYFFSFGNLFGGPTNASTPSNPNTNIDGGKLGYFSAHTSEDQILIIQ